MCQLGNAVSSTVIDTKSWEIFPQAIARSTKPSMMAMSPRCVCSCGGE